MHEEHGREILIRVNACRFDDARSSSELEVESRSAARRVDWFQEMISGGPRLCR